jgi:hypothetical protein
MTQTTREIAAYPQSLPGNRVVGADVDEVLGKRTV